MLIVITNHQLNKESKTLLDGFSEYGETIAIDSGSVMTESERKTFEIRLPNVYYSGLFNEAVRQAILRKHEHLFFIASDVQVNDYKQIIDAAKQSLSEKRIAVYAPSSTGSAHDYCLNQGSDRLRKVPFVEGYCFATRTNLIKQMYPVDTKINYLGWGLDVELGLLALKNNCYSVIDDRYIVHHNAGCGYSRKEASKQLTDWRKNSQANRLYYHLVKHRKIMLPKEFTIFIFRCYYRFIDWLKKDEQRKET